MEYNKNPLAEKKVLLATWNISNPDYYQNRDWIPLLERLSKKLITFSPRDNYLRYGKKLMNQKLLNLIRKEKPNYAIFSLSYDEIDIETLIKIRKISPETKTLNFFGDDNWRFDDWSRYYALFFDQNLISEQDNSNYLSDGIKNTLFLHGVNTHFLRPLKIKKEIDVSFIGMPIRDRKEYILFLKKAGIDISLFGPGWEDDDDLKNIYKGFLNSEDYLKTINKSKINISFSKTILKGTEKNDTQLKGRVFEVLATKSFLLAEKFSGSEKFSKTFQKILFKDKKELLEKINYYLKNEKERETISNILYKEILKEFSWESVFIHALNEAAKSKPLQIRFPKSRNNFIVLSECDLKLDKKRLTSKLKNVEYVGFKTRGTIHNKLKNYFQILSLEKSKKQISCCDYYSTSRLVGDYLLFTAKKSFKSLEYEQFLKFLTFDQLMITKKYFLEHLNVFQDKKLNHLQKEEIIFVSIPLLRTNHLKIKDYISFEKSFRMKFMDNLYSIVYQKKLSIYPLNLILFALIPRNFSILKHLYLSLFSRENWKKINS